MASPRLLKLFIPRIEWRSREEAMFFPRCPHSPDDEAQSYIRRGAHCAISTSSHRVFLHFPRPQNRADTTSCQRFRWPLRCGTCPRHTTCQSPLLRPFPLLIRVRTDHHPAPPPTSDLSPLRYPWNFNKSVTPARPDKTGILPDA